MENREEYEAFLREKTGAKCGRCACDLTYGNDAGTGFCKECEAKENEHWWQCWIGHIKK